MKLALVTRADRNIEYYTKYTHPYIKKYADQCNAEFVVLDHQPPVMSEDNKPHFRIMKLHELLDTYDRILSLDSDCVINKNCPNLFEIVPEDCIGTMYEDFGPGVLERREKFKQIQQKYGDIGWETGYINTGVFVVSRMHKSIFEPINGTYWDGECSDDVHIGYLVKKYNFKVHDLGYKFNHMRCHSEPWNGSPHRLDSYILHFAGGQGMKLGGVLGAIEDIYGKQ